MREQIKAHKAKLLKEIKELGEQALAKMEEYCEICNEQVTVLEFSEDDSARGAWFCTVEDYHGGIEADELNCELIKVKNFVCSNQTKYKGFAFKVRNNAS